MIIDGIVIKKIVTIRPTILILVTGFFIKPRPLYNIAKVRIPTPQPQIPNDNSGPIVFLTQSAFIVV